MADSIAEINHIAQEGKLKRGAFVRLKQFSANIVKGKRIIIVLDLDILEELGECEKIGTPQMVGGKDEEEDVKPQPTTISSNGFYGNKLPQAGGGQGQGQGQSLPSRTASAAAHANIYPIEALSPYAHKWTIKARCTSKGEIKHWHNKNGEGKLFSVNLLDESGEIRATAFQEQCTQLYDVFQEGSVYYISSPCKVQLAKKQFSNLNNDYEINFERDSLVEKVSLWIPSYFGNKHKLIVALIQPGGRSR